MEQKVAELLNQQINKEFYSAYLYLDMSNYYDEQDLDGFANWYKIQAQEERDHAMLFLQYLHNNGEKVTLLAVCGKNAIAHGIKAGDIIRSIAPIVGGKGGGKPDSAMGGGTDVLKVDDALAAVDDFVAANVKE